MPGEKKWPSRRSAVSPHMDIVEFIEILLGILYTVLLFASAFLSIGFLIKYREHRWRWLPCVSIIALFFILFVPESGWSDVRSQWHGAALGLVWSIWIMCLVFGFLRSGRGALLISLRIAFTIMGVSALAVSIFSLVESWTFLHSL